jgi:hypothetical protein
MFRSQALRFARHGAGTLTSAVFILCGVPAMMYGLIWLVDPETVRMMRQEPPMYQTAFRILTWMALPWFLMFEVVQVRPLYVLPITNRQIVIGQLACGMLAISALHLLTVVSYRIVFGATVPFWGPLLMMCPAVVVAAGLAVWVIDFRWWRPLVVAAAIFVIFPLFALRKLTLYAIPMVTFVPRGWLTPTVVEFVAIMILAVIAYRLALQGVERDRCGEVRPWPDLDTLLNSFAARLSRLWRSPVAAGPYRSGASAQFWFEWWQKGLVLPIIAACIWGASLILAYESPRDWLRGVASGSPMVVGLFLGMAGLILGLVNLGRQGMLISEYRATRPLTDAQLAYAVLKAALASAVAAVAVVGVCVLIVIVWTWTPFASDWEFTELFVVERASGELPMSGQLVVSAGVGWCLLGLGASLAMSGRGWVLASPAVLVVGAFLAAPLLSRLPISSHTRDLLLRGAGWSVLVCLAIGTIVAYVVAIRRRLIPAAMAWMGGVAALATIGLVLVLSYPWMETVQNRWMIAVLAMLLAAPLATAPLALSWNRHR